MGNRRIGRKRMEAALRKMNATKSDTAGSRSGLRGFDMPAFELQPSKYYGIFDDFQTVSGVTDLAQDDDFMLAHGSSGLCGAMWDCTTGGSGSPTITLDNAEVGGAVKLLAGTADDDVARLFAVNNPFVLDASNPRKIWWEARLKLSDVDASGFFVGLAGNGVDATVDTAIMAGGLADGIGWQILDGQAAVTFASIAAVGDSETVVQSSTSAADGTYVLLQFHFDGSTVHYYINGDLSHSSALTLPTDGTLICPHIEYIQQTGDDDTMHVDYVRACMER
tara:strand:+ start:1649 stop:2485 length:837 start_codon:yes stop_codon:yes gene_type:complete